MDQPGEAKQTVGRLDKAGRPLSAIYIEMSEAERSAVTSRTLSREIRLQLSAAQKAARVPTAEEMLSGTRMFVASATPRRQTIWVPMEVKTWLRSLAADQNIAMTVLVRVMCPTVFSPSTQEPSLPPSNLRVI